jgi:ferric-dicitrate binding protein FerR (iron transport regulator)
MQHKLREDYEVEDFVSDESFVNYHYQLDAQDVLSWRQWLQLHPHKAALAQQARTMIDNISLSLPEHEFNIELQKIKQAISPEIVHMDSYLPTKPATVNSFNLRTALQFAAVGLALIIGIGALLYIRKTDSAAPPLAETVNNHSYPMKIVLSDSTEVTLASGSSLKYPMHFAPGIRDVFLTGDAKFHVKRNEKARFKVFSENLVATVLGTIFNFTSSGDSAVVIELLQGKLNVAMEGNNDSTASVLLYPNQKVVYSKNTHAFRKSEIELRATIAFQHNSFPEVADKLRKAFGIIVINNSKKTDWRFTGEFQNASAKDVIDNICYIKNLSATIKGDSVFIK